MAMWCTRYTYMLSNKSKCPTDGCSPISLQSSINKFVSMRLIGGLKSVTLAAVTLRRTEANALVLHRDRMTNVSSTLNNGVKELT